MYRIDSNRKQNDFCYVDEKTAIDLRTVKCDQRIEMGSKNAQWKIVVAHSKCPIVIICLYWLCLLFVYFAN